MCIELAIYKCIFDVVLVQQFLWLPFLKTHLLYNDYDPSAEYIYCNASALAAILAFCSQFSLIASELCFLVISVDLRIAYTNPFSSFQQNRKYYALFVIGTSLFFAIILMCLGPEIYGLGSEGIVWVQTKRISLNSDYFAEPNYPKFFLLYFEESIIYIYCLWANFQYYRSHTKGLSKTLSNRINIMQRSKRFTLAYVAVELLTLGSEFISFVNYYDYVILNSIPPYLYSMRGVFTLVVILYANKHDLSWRDLNPFGSWCANTHIDERDHELVALEGLLLQPHLNAALRVELLYFTTKGIMHAARDFEAASVSSGDSNSSVTDSTSQNTAHNKTSLSAHTSRPVSDHTAQQPSPTDEEESRCYSFDEHPYLGIRPSLLLNADHTSSPMHHPQQQRRSQSARQQAQSVDVEGNGVALRSQQSNHRNPNATTATELSEQQTAAFAEMQRLQMLQAQAVQSEIETALLEQDAFRHSLAGDRVFVDTLLMRPSTTLLHPPAISSNARDLDHQDQDHDDEESRDTLPMTMTNSSSAPVRSSQSNGASNSNGAPARGTSLWSRFSFMQSFTAPSASAAARNNASSPTDSKTRNSNSNSRSTSRARDLNADVEFSMRSQQQPLSSSSSSVDGSTSVSLAAQQLFASFSVSKRSNQPQAHKSDVERGEEENEEELHWQRHTQDPPSRSASRTGASFDSRGLHNAKDHNGNTAATSAGGARRSESHSVHSERSGSSMSSTREILLRAVHSALSTATQAATSVFSPAYREFRFKDYSPRLFAQVRALHGINAEDYARSFESTCRERFTEGRSGAFLFYSADQKVLVKSTTAEDLYALREILPMYVAHLQREPHSLLCRFLGAHCITMYGVDIYFVVMLNIFPTGANMSERYDLKGSWVNRHGNARSRNKQGRLVNADRVHGAPLLQDNDLLHTLSLHPRVAKEVASQIRRDVVFLRDNGRMDYSLLLGVRRERFKVHSDGAQQQQDSLSSRFGYASIPEDTSSSSQSSSSQQPPHHKNHLQSAPALEDPFRREEDGAMRAYIVEGPGMYYIGLIDLLQGWTWGKRLERLTKVYLKGCDADGLSAMPPEPYAERFYRRCVVDVFDHLDEAHSTLYIPDSERHTNTSGSVQQLLSRQPEVRADSCSHRIVDVEGSDLDSNTDGGGGADGGVVSPLARAR